MKYLLVICLLLITVTSKAQDYLIGRDNKSVDTWMSGYNHPVIDYGWTTNKMQKYVTYKMDSTGDFTNTFYFNPETNICIGFRDMVNKIILPTVIQGLNEDYRKISDNVWVSFDNVYQVKLSISESFIILIHTKI